MKNKRILVTGADGMVGSYVNDVFSDHDLYLTDLVDMSKAVSYTHLRAHEPRHDLV